jgi:hypothetical protein
MSMDSISPISFDENKKTEIEKTLALSILEAIKNNSLSYEETKKAATYILDHIEAIKNQDQLIYFLENLAVYWPNFKIVLVMEKQGQVEKKEQIVINRLSSYIKNSQTN